MRITYHVIPFVVLQTACSGGGGSAEPIKTELLASSCTSSRPIVVELFGDSANTAKSPYDNIIIGPTNNLQAYMDTAFGAGKVIVRSKAVGGTTSQQLIDGTDGLNTPWPTTKSGDVVLVKHGIDDSFLKTPLGSHRANITAFAKAGVILQTPLPTYVEVTDLGDQPRIMREVAQVNGTDIIDLGAWVSEHNWRAWTADQLHPTQDGWKAIVQGFFGPEVAKRVAALLC